VFYFDFVLGMGNTGLLFSATFQARVEALARHALNDPIRVTVGVVGAVSQL